MAECLGISFLLVKQVTDIAMRSGDLRLVAYLFGDLDLLLECSKRSIVITLQTLRARELDERLRDLLSVTSALIKSKRALNVRQTSVHVVLDYARVPDREQRFRLI